MWKIRIKADFFEITQGVNEKTYVICEIGADEIIKLEVANEEKVLETIYE